MNIEINGNTHQVPDACTLADALSAHPVPDRGVAVAVDGAVVPRADWPRNELRPGAQVEVLTAVQGG
ncbi:sulfur carrier protein ThiS [Saccharopolyspora sp. HNM0983]|uniref:Sulfur carrier protein ThiS n=1 Tax=Saccharopolyspora montiporae TaxID=2781240 RepID=A0A929B6F8_9PSEU|nr:sulfur carrier protein ThiS [Saccharopolyspora sp. HNM0983]